MKNITKLNKKVIYNHSPELRKNTAPHIKCVYILESIAKVNENAFISCDKSLFTHILDKQLWVVGLINSNTKELRMELTYSHDQNTLKKIIAKRIPVGNNIIKNN